MEGFYGLMTIAGPIILALALIAAIALNRRSRAAEARTEEATRRMYDEQNRDDTARE